MILHLVIPETLGLASQASYRVKNIVQLIKILFKTQSSRESIIKSNATQTLRESYEKQTAPLPVMLTKCT